MAFLAIQNNPSILAKLNQQATSCRKAQLLGGEGTNFNVPPSDENTSANGLTIIINIPPMCDNSTEEAAGQSRGLDLVTSLNAKDPGELHYATLDSNKSNVGPRGMLLPDLLINYKNYKRATSVLKLRDDYNRIFKQVGGIEGAKKMSPNEWGAVWNKNKTTAVPTLANALRVYDDAKSTYKYHSSLPGQVNDFITFANATANTAGSVRPFPSWSLGLGLRSTPISNVQTPCDCREAEARGLKPMNAEDPDQLHYATLNSNQSNVGTRGMKISKEEMVKNRREFEGAMSYGIMRDLMRVMEMSKLSKEETDIKRDQFDQAVKFLVDRLKGAEKMDEKTKKSTLEGFLQHYEHRQRDKLKQIIHERLRDPNPQSDPTDELIKLDEDYEKERKIREQQIKDIINSGGVGSRSAPISNLQTGYDDGENMTLGLNLSNMINKGFLQNYENRRKQKLKFEGVGSRSAAITNQSQAEGHCPPCGKQMASQVNSVKETLDRAEARDSQLIDQVRQQQQARRMKKKRTSPTPNGHSTSEPIDQQETSFKRDLVTCRKFDKKEMKFSVIDNASLLLLLNYIKSKFSIHSECLRLRGGEGVDLNKPVSYDQTSANGLTIIINIPPISEGLAAETTGQSRVFNLGYLGDLSASRGSEYCSVEQKPFACSEAEARGFKLSGVFDKANKYKQQFDKAYGTVKNVTKQGHQLYDQLDSIRQFKLPKNKLLNSFDIGEKVLNDRIAMDEIDRALTMNKKELEKYKQHKSSDMVEDDRMQMAEIDRALAMNQKELDKARLLKSFVIEDDRMQMAEIDRALAMNQKELDKARLLKSSVMIEDDRMQMAEIDRALAMNRKGGARGYNLSSALEKSGHESYDEPSSFGGVGLRSVPIRNQPQAEGYCSPCGKQIASPVCSITEKLDQIEARDIQIIDQVKKQQQARRMEVVQMLDNTM